MKVIRKQLKKDAAKYDELYDTLMDDTPETLREMENPEVVDFDALDMGDIPRTDVEVDDILFDNLEDEVTPEGEPLVPEDELPGEKPEDFPEPSDEVPEFATPQDAMRWAVDNKRVVQIKYSPMGRRGRGGKRQLTREIRQRKKLREQGLPDTIVIRRVVEPHYIFTAGNGNELVVTYDRSIIGIRAYIMKQIKECTVIEKKVRNPFTPRPYIGTNAMNNTQEKLKKLAASLEDKKMTKVASVVKDALQSWENLRIAQYVGVQGYWLRNRRCWDNCYRQKRTTSPGTPAQEVWMQCWDEYQQSIGNSKSGWEKYASDDEKTKSRLTDEQVQKWNKLFAEKVEKRVEAGTGRPEAIYQIIEEESTKFAGKIMDSAADLIIAGEDLGDKEVADALTAVAHEMVKEAGLGDFFRDKWEGIKDWWRNRGGDLKGIQQRLRNLNYQAIALERYINKITLSPAPTQASKDSIIIEAKTTIKEAQPEMAAVADPQLYTYFRRMYQQAQMELSQLEQLESKTPQGSQARGYLNAGINNLRSFTETVGPQLGPQQTIEAIRGFTQELVRATGQAMTGLDYVTGMMDTGQTTTDTAGDTVVPPEAAPDASGEVPPETGAASPNTAAPPPEATAPAEESPAPIDAKGLAEKAKQDTQLMTLLQTLRGKSRINAEGLGIVGDFFQSQGVPLTSANFLSFMDTLLPKKQPFGGKPKAGTPVAPPVPPPRTGPNRPVPPPRPGTLQ